MDKEKLSRLEIEETELEAIEDALEEKQNELETRRDVAESNGNTKRKEQLDAELAEVVELLKQVKEEIKAAKNQPKAAFSKTEEKVRGTVPTAAEETAKRAVPTAIDGMEEATNKVVEKIDSVKSFMEAKKDKKAEEAKVKAEEKAKEAFEKCHEDELKAKAAKIRKEAAAEETKKAKEEKEKRKEEEKAAKKDEAETVSEGDLSEYEKCFNDGVAAYAKGKYGEAFQNLYKIGNAGKASRLGKEKIGQAEQLLARMYKNGQGVAVDDERAWFWFEKAAEHENVEGCLALGQHNADMTPKNPQEETEFRENALKYFKIAGENDSKVGKEKFIEICIKKKNLVSGGDIRTARRFLDDLIELEEDSFIKQTLKDKKKRLSEKDAKGKKNNNKLYNGYADMIAMIGALATILGVMCICNYILESQDTIFNFAKVIPNYFRNYQAPRLPYLLDWGWESLAEFDEFSQSKDGMVVRWGLFLFPVGFLLSAISSVEKRGNIANIVCEAALFFSVISGFMTYSYYVSLTSFHLVSWHGIGIAAVIIFNVQIFRLPGMIIRYFIEK